MSGEQWTLPQIAKRVGMEYRTLKTWRDCGLIAPSVHDAGGGSGRPDLYSERDACLIEGLSGLREAGLGLDALALVARQWRTRFVAGCPICHSSLSLVEHSRISDTTNPTCNGEGAVSVEHAKGTDDA